MATFSQDLRNRVLKGLETGERASSIAARLDVSARWVYLVKLRHERHQEREPRQVGGYRQSKIANKEQSIREWIGAQPDLTLCELCERLEQEGIQISVSGLWYQLEKWGITFKKNASRLRAGARRRPSPTR